MDRGLDGFSCYAVSKAQTPLLGAFHNRIRAFLERVTTAAGIHLFPFRTEKLSPPAPMVLRGRPRGRVGRRPFFMPGPRPVYSTSGERKRREDLWRTKSWTKSSSRSSGRGSRG